jgi:hypothetical protein
MLICSGWVWWQGGQVLWQINNLQAILKQVLSKCPYNYANFHFVFCIKTKLTYMMIEAARFSKKATVSKNIPTPIMTTKTTQQHT